MEQEQKVTYKLADMQKIVQLLDSMQWTGTSNAYNIVEIVNILQKGTVETPKTEEAEPVVNAE